MVNHLFIQKKTTKLVLEPISEKALANPRLVREDTEKWKLKIVRKSQNTFAAEEASVYAECKITTVISNSEEHSNDREFLGLLRSYQRWVLSNVPLKQDVLIFRILSSYMLFRDLIPPELHMDRIRRQKVRRKRFCNRKNPSMESLRSERHTQRIQVMWVKQKR